MSDNLAKILARAYVSHAELRWKLLEMDDIEEIKDRLVMGFVAIQGLKNRELVKRVSEMPIDYSAIPDELMRLLERQEGEDKCHVKKDYTNRSDST